MCTWEKKAGNTVVNTSAANEGCTRVINVIKKRIIVQFTAARQRHTVAFHALHAFLG